MQRRLFTLSLALLLVACTQTDAVVAPAVTASPYVGETHRMVKTLSHEQMQGLMTGAGMGYAMAAELNGYPGPKHVLELADSLALTPAQQQQVQAAFEAMQADAQQHGRAYIEAERALDALFASGQATPERVRQHAERAATLEAQVRLAHLQAHLAMMDVLTPPQIQTYVRLRGYTDGATPNLHQGHH